MQKMAQDKIGPTGESGSNGSTVRTANDNGVTNRQIAHSNSTTTATTNAADSNNDDSGRNGRFQKHHRRVSSLWVPPTPMLPKPAEWKHKSGEAIKRLDDLWQACKRKACCCKWLARTANRGDQGNGVEETRLVVPNHKFVPTPTRYLHPNRLRFSSNQISTTKYTPFTFVPRNLFEQFHRFANVYFVFICVLNFIPQLEAFNKFLAMLPVAFIISLTAIKDAFEDWRRHKSDVKINHSTCRVWDNEQNRYRKLEWQHVLVGDMVHLSCNEIVPADILLLRSADPMAVCYLETSNLDGESNLKQRHVVQSMIKHSTQGASFLPTDFSADVECELPNTHIYRFHGNLVHSDRQKEPVNKNNLLLRGCQIRNTDYVEGIVLYAGHETKAMLNNSGPRYKRSSLEKRTNYDVLWCVMILLILCIVAVICGEIFKKSFTDPMVKSGLLSYLSGEEETFTHILISIGSFVIYLQILIPLSLYISIELIKLGQNYFMQQDLAMYHEESDKRMQCRALNIPEELGQIQYVMSDKTGTLTENVMVFRRCTIGSTDYGPDNDKSVSFPAMKHDYDKQQATEKENKAASDSKPDSNENEIVKNGQLDNKLQHLHEEQPGTEKREQKDLRNFFVVMAICNTVVVNAEPHSDNMDESGFMLDGTFVAGNSSFHTGAQSVGKPQITANGVMAINGAIQQTGSNTVPDQHFLPPIVTVQRPNQLYATAKIEERTTSNDTLLTPLDDEAGYNNKWKYKQKQRGLDNDSVTTAETSDTIEKVMETSRSVPNMAVLAEDESEVIRQVSSSDTDGELRADTPEESCPLDQSSEPDHEASETESEEPTKKKSARSSSVFTKLSVSLSSSTANFNKTLRGIRASPMLKRLKITKDTPDPLEATMIPANPIYEAESPDELALVHAANAYGVKLLKRHVNYVLIRWPNARVERFDVLHTLPFDSDRKRMSVIVRNYKTGRLILLCKGADLAIMNVLSDTFKNSPYGQEVIASCQHRLSSYASYGLRTLCVATRELEQEEYKAWKVVQDEAEMDWKNQEAHLIQAANLIESDLQLIGVTGIEDRLQDGVPETIESLRRAGINVWVLTGDKIETAVNIAYACKLFYPGMQLITLNARSTLDSNAQDLLKECSQRLDASAANTRTGLVVNGPTLRECLAEENVEQFVNIVQRCTSVLCCRTTPMQKGKVVALVKERLHGKVLAIGDGANDVSMIQCADVGVGISGQEGMQAVMASDFALARFHFLCRLLLVHGHWSYDRLARAILYFLYKNAVMVFLIYWYQPFTAFSGQCPSESLFTMLFPIVFTSVPPLVFGTYEQDISDQTLLSHPTLYCRGRNSQLYRWYSFWLEMVDAAWQSLAMYFTAHFTYYGTDVGIWQFGHLLLSELVIINCCHLLIISKHWTWPLLLTISASIASYFILFLLYCLFPAGVLQMTTDFPVMVAEMAFIDVRFWAALLLAVVVSLMPRMLTQIWLHTFSPSEVTTMRLKEAQKTGKYMTWLQLWRKTKDRAKTVPIDEATANQATTQV